MFNKLLYTVASKKYPAITNTQISFNMLKIDMESTEQPSNPQDDLCTRFMRKKFKCIMTFLVMLILFFEVFKTVMEKIDKETLNDLLSIVKQSNNINITSS